ncbi:MAG: aspartate carbamoyltransferase regulatory subunit [Thermoprotei archaeon]|jgi:aspartate carbamoyltransferase regulatory subunit
MSEISEMKVSKIKDGTVIDHVPAGRALDVLRLLNLTGKEGFIISLVMNVPSKKFGKKDIVKVEGLELESNQVNKLALIAPTATINIVRNYDVIEKKRVNLPDRIIGILSCQNPNCITRKEREPVIASFIVISKKPLVVQCEYCGRLMNEDNVIKQLVR